MSKVKLAAAVLVLCALFGNIETGSILHDIVFDENCPLDIDVHDIRISECDGLPCTIKRGKRYWAEGDFRVLRNSSNIVLKCSTIYLGRHIELLGHGGCSNLIKGSCPVVEGENYTSATTFKLPYYVPPMKYTLYCSMIDENDENMMCGYGTGKVV